MICETNIRIQIVVFILVFSKYNNENVKFAQTANKIRISNIIIPSLNIPNDSQKI